LRTIVHLSDLHFGRSDPQLVDPLIRTILELNPTLIAISGDLTQRARSHQFQEARAFLDAFPQPKIVVPGNHDIPLYNAYYRFLRPLDKYRRYITADLQPTYADEEMIVTGVSTARSLVIKGGRINQEQLAWVKQKFCALPDEVVKILVTHHPFDLPGGHSDRDLVGRARMAMTGLAQCGADLFLAGHLHVSHTGSTAQRYQIEGHSALVVQAGTAISTRGRGEANSFNLIHLDHPDIIVERLSWSPDSVSFTIMAQESFRHSAAGWARVETE
jgi:3',5'-cyclic AMP phosphodiesterase CpdA